jgi:competence protein ComEA
LTVDPVAERARGDDPAVWTDRGARPDPSTGPAGTTGVAGTAGVAPMAGVAGTVDVASAAGVTGVAGAVTEHHEPAARAVHPEPGRFGAALTALVPESLRGSRLDPGRRGVVAIAVVALFAATVAGVVAWRARPETIPVPTPLPDTASGSPASAPVVVVAVAGKVRRPGLVRLPVGSRVADAITAAGGLLPGADMGLINLARKLVDGELIAVGVTSPGAPAGAPTGAGQGSLLDLNTATVAQLDGLPGVGQVLAQRLVDYRTAHGGFRSVDQLREVDGIGESRFQKLRQLVTV